MCLIEMGRLLSLDEFQQALANKALLDQSAMIAELRRELEVAIHGETPLVDIVAMLRRYKAQGVTQNEVYSILESLRSHTAPEDVDGRILEIGDFVAGFCSLHMKIWND